MNGAAIVRRSEFSIAVHSIQNWFAERVARKVLNR
jgi:hypothetical protein